MKNILVALLLLVPFTASAVDVGVAKKYARVVYDVAVDGGESTPHALDYELPANSFITDVFVLIDTPFTDSGTGSLALQCGGTRNLMGYIDITAATTDYYFGGAAVSTQTAGSSMILSSGTGTSGAVNSLPAACTVTAVVRGDDGYVPLTAGKLTAFIEYFNK